MRIKFIYALVLIFTLEPLGAGTRALAADEAAKANEAFQKQFAAEEAKRKQEEAAAAAQKKAEDQRAAQQAAAKKSKQGSQMATYLAAGLAAAGMVAMVASMTAKEPAEKKSWQDRAMMLMLGGQAAGMVGNMMQKNADQGSANASNLDSLGNPLNTSIPDLTSPGGSSTIPVTTGGNPDSNTLAGTDVPSSDSVVKIDPQSLRTGELGRALDNLEKTTGINRDQFASALASGATPADMLDGRFGLTKDGVNSALEQAKASLAGGGSLSGGDVQKLAESAGLGDLAKSMADLGGTDFDGGGKGLESALAGASTLPPLDLSALAPPLLDAAKTETAGDKVPFNFEKDVSPEIQRELAAKGVVAESIFELVARRYRALAPIMLGYGPSVETRTKTN